MQSYAEALALYIERKNRGSLKRGIKLGNNTYLEWSDQAGFERGGITPEWFAVKLHKTHVVIFHVDGRIVLNDGGWLTATTKARMNEYLSSGWGVYSDRGIWFLSHNCVELSHPYADGITIHSDGTVTGQGPDPKAQQKLRKRIRAYSKAYIAAFYAGEVPAPGSGDCWGCLMVATDGTTPIGGSDHMISHLDEAYFVPSILSRAAKRFGCSQMAQHTLAVAWNPSEAAERGFALSDDWSCGTVRDQLEKAVRRHCYAECGLGV